MECLLSSRQRIQRAALGLELCVRWGLETQFKEFLHKTCSNVYVQFLFSTLAHSPCSISPCHICGVLCSELGLVSVPEVPVEFPLLPCPLSLSEDVELQTHGDEQLKEGHGP